LRRLGRDDYRDGALRLIRKLARDPQYAVRRSALRAWSEIDAGTLEEYVRQQMDSGSAVERMHAAEAAGWLGVRDPVGLSNQYLDELSSARENQVAEGARRELRQLRLRHAVEAHLQLLEQQRDDPNAWVRFHHASGHSIAKYGDDDVQARLKSMSWSRSYPPNARWWFRQLGKELEKNWQETTKKWPDPWIFMHGQLEKFAGSILLAGRDAVACKGTVWNRRARDGAESGEWGGQVTVTAPSGLSGVSAGSIARISRDERSWTDIYITAGSLGALQFVGSGPFPRSTVAGDQTSRI
jgi:hypothetical protein